MSDKIENKFKNSNGVYLLRELFYEFAQNKENVVYTLKREDHEGYPSLHRLFLEIADVTEYRFATQCLDSWEHWEQLSACTWFQPYLEKMRRELEVSQRSTALSKIMEASKGGTRDAFIAAKYIAEGWDKPKSGKGRPSKDDIRKAANEIAEDKSRIEADYLRLIK